MNLTERDRKLVTIIVPLVVLAAYWFLILGPKRDEASQAADQLTQQEARLATAKQTADSARSAETAFQSDFTEVVRLGKAIPAGVDMPSLLVQLESAAEGTGIRFTKIATGERDTATTPAPATSTPSEGTTSGGTPVAAGGETAQSAPGTAVESANNAQATANQNAANAESSGVSPTDTQTSTTPDADAAAGSTTNAAGATTAGLETVPLEMEFVGDFFNLADFFHSVKRFVRVANRNVLVGGRLITIEGVQWASDSTLFPKLKASINATVYLAPKTQGTTAGATPQGPAETTTAGTSTASDGSSSPVPTATATP
ncbi:MAG: type II secretion system protein M [Thermoleophilaceae bacterium]|nr:type II secretion system protein M [Thermoleophilaceae bacterium]